MILEHKKFFSKIECDTLIKFCLLKKLKPIATSNPFDKNAKFFFNPENNVKGLVFDVKDKIISWAIKRICKELTVDENKLEHPRFQEYETLGSYRDHYDFILVDRPYTNYHFSRGGQRLKSFIVYLNDDFKGGETIFKKQNLIIRPEIGKIVEWTNVLPKTDINSKESYDLSTLHSSSPVTVGKKYSLVLFEREHKFIGTEEEWLNRFPDQPSENENKGYST